MKSLKISDDTELKNGGNMDQIHLIPENTTKVDIVLDIDIESQSEIDFYEDHYCIDDQYEEQCKFDYECEWEAECQCNSTPNPLPNEINQTYEDYGSLIHSLYERMPVDCSALRKSWNNFLIYKSNNEFCYYYSVYDTSKKGERGHYLELGDCMDPDDVSKVISYYLETGKCFGHK